MLLLSVIPERIDRNSNECKCLSTDPINVLDPIHTSQVWPLLMHCIWDHKVVGDSSSTLRPNGRPIPIQSNHLKLVYVLATSV